MDNKKTEHNTHDLTYEEIMVEIKKKIKAKKCHGRLYFIFNDWFYGITIFVMIANFVLSAVSYYTNISDSYKIAIIYMNGFGSLFGLVRVTAKLGNRSKFLLTQKATATNLYFRAKFRLISPEQLCEEFKKLDLSDADEPST